MTERLPQSEGPEVSEVSTDSRPSASPSSWGWMVQLGFSILAGLVVYAFVSMAKQAETRRACEPLVQLRPRYLGSDRMAPDFDLPDGMGGRIRLADYRGKVVFLHFWTRTCPPCLDELPALARFAERMRSRRDVVVLTVTIDDGPQAVADVYQTLLQGPPPFKVAYDPDNTVVRPKFGTKLFPETWLIDPQGRIRARLDGVPMAGDACEVAWDSPLMLSAIDALQAPMVCDITLDPKVARRAEPLIAPCLR